MEIWQYNNKGVYLRTFPSLSNAAKAVGTYAGNISNAIKSGNKSKGYYWKKAEGKKLLKIKTHEYRRGGKAVIIFKKGKYFCEASTLSEASDITKIPQTTIRSNIKGAQSQNKIFSFKLKV